MKNQPNSSQQIFSLGVVVVMAAVLILLNLMINFSGAMHDFFKIHLDSWPTRVLLNFLFIWIIALLVVSYNQWRKTNSRESELQAVIEGIGLDVLLVVDKSRAITICNGAVRRIFGWQPSEIIGKKTDILYSDRRKHPSQPREIYEALEEDGYHYGLATGLRRNGTRIPLEIITGTLAGRDGAVMLIRDISERVAMEAEKAALEERTRQAKRLESLGMLAGGIAHDFRNILTVVRGHGELALRRATKAGDEMTINSMTEVLKGADRAHDLCQNLMAFAGRAPRHIHPMNLSTVVCETTEMLQAKFGDRVTLVQDIAEGLPEIEVDDVQIRQVIMNIVSNAIDAVGEGTGEVVVRTGRRRCDLAFFKTLVVDADQPVGDYVFVSVKDNGCGMDEETRQKVCEPFFTTKRSGHGMGMAAVMGIVRSHHGLMTITSTVGEGSEFTVLLPLVVPDIPDTIEEDALGRAQ